MENNKILGLIGLATRARKICFGADSVEERIIKNKVRLVIIAEDASYRTKQKFEKLSEKYGKNLIIFSNIDNLSKSIGKLNKAIIGIEDINFANEIKRIFDGGEIIG
ncbi:MAG: ribosomal L7Ae/L30e/S12e/Gadd45 family protein [Clostridia bacterium]|nr:ribosomal L7Ae/L30e/S12e/Gadd45 family protein [Clostridia bacterium]